MEEKTGKQRVRTAAQSYKDNSICMAKAESACPTFGRKLES